jgi:hypothetical protein
MEKKKGEKKGQDIFLLFKNRRGSLVSSLLICKLQAEKIPEPEKIGLMQPYIS